MRINENNCRLRLFVEYIQTQKKYPTSLGKIAILNWISKRQSHKMAKLTQTIRGQIANELFESVWPFCEIGT